MGSRAIFVRWGSLNPLASVYEENFTINGRWNIFQFYRKKSLFLERWSNLKTKGSSFNPINDFRVFNSRPKDNSLHDSHGENFKTFIALIEFCN